MSDDTAAKVRDMAKLAILSNKISPAHEKNLKTFPFIFFDGIMSCKIDYDLSNESIVDTEENKENVSIKYKIHHQDTSHHRISYWLEMDETYENNHLSKRFDALKKSIHSLLWKNINVQVYFDKKLVFESKNGK